MDQVRLHETTKTSSPRVLGFGQGRQLELRREGGDWGGGEREPSMQLLGKCHLKKEKKNSRIQR